MKLLLMLN